jgi:hypothetical protein
MNKEFAIVGKHFPEINEFCGHNHAKSCVKDMLQANNRGRIVVKFIEQAIQSTHIEDEKVTALVQESFAQLKQNKKGKLSDKYISKAKDLKKLYKAKVKELTNASADNKTKQIEPNGKDEKVENNEKAENTLDLGSSSSLVKKSNERTLESRMKALPKALVDLIGLYLVADMLRDVQGNLADPKLTTLKPWIKEIGNRVKSLDLSKFLLSTAHLQEIVTNFPNLETFRNNQFDKSYFENMTDKELFGRIMDPHFEARFFKDEGLQILSRLTSLRVLEIKPGNGAHYFTNKGFEHIGKLEQLETLVIGTSEDVFDAGIGHLAKLKKLITLDAGSSMTNIGLKIIGTFAHLKHLNIAGSEQINGEGLEHLVQLTELETLSLNSCDKIEDNGITHVAKLPKLYRLDLTWTAITNNGLQRLAPLQSLRHLEIAGCDGITNDGMQHIAKLTHLQSLAISGEDNPIKPEGFEALSGLQELTALKVEDCKIKDSVFESLAKFPKLAHLLLTPEKTVKTRVLEKGMQHLSKLQTLQTIGFENIEVNDRILESLAKFPSLTLLSLDDSEKVTDKGCEHLSTCATLKEIHFGFLKKVTSAGLMHFTKLKLRSLSFMNTGKAFAAATKALRNQGVEVSGKQVLAK